MIASATLQGLKGLDKALSKAKAESEAIVLQRVTEGVVDIHGRVIKSIQKVSMGKTKKRYGFGRKARLVKVSKPGDPPNTDTGALVQSYKFEIVRARLFGYVGSGLEYSKHLEFGTLKMKARPVLRPALRGYLNKIKNKRYPKFKGRIR